MRYPILFTGANKAMVVLGIIPRQAYVDLSSTDITVRMGWAFRAVIPRAAVMAAEHDDGRVTGWGVHGWRGTWLVNGSADGLVRLDIDPPVKARTAMVPVRLRTLRVSLADPTAFLADLAA
ncbi:MAG: hypothetical protein V9E89_01250 [Ilumatobacteraceae bacterium]|jgi:hypothetical protein